MKPILETAVKGSAKVITILELDEKDLRIWDQYSPLHNYTAKTCLFYNIKSESEI